MSAPEKEIVAASPDLPRDEKGEPVFFEPWQAKAFAMTLALHEKGTFTWPEWAAALGRACADDDSALHATAKARADAYFAAWLHALEDILAARRMLMPGIIDETTRAWQRAAEATPHGTPILYEAGLRNSPS